jgi:V-type H+-transporting ATPase subunit E
MNDTEVHAQIQQMVQFIHQEAQEKANEIKLKADEEFNINKLRTVEAEKTKIRAEYEIKEKQVEVKKRITQSNETRFARLKTLTAKDEALKSLLEEAASKLTALTSKPDYPKLLESLLLEGLIQLADQKVSVKGVAGQEAATKGAIAPATAAYKKWATEAHGAAWAADIAVTYDSSSSLDKKCVGGVELVGFGGKINLQNTLLSRLDLAYETRLPQLRASLFQ